ncbi:MAG: aminotransferase class V-fold PLP-dependent enzyme [Planctomycetes bacterium]|nr:aminotransferase class V-fold PLP-dependent enzyme [Planctomycetota bacterium]
MPMLVPAEHLTSGRVLEGRHAAQLGAEPDWDTFRALFPLLRTDRYLAACSQGPLATPVEVAVRRFMDSWRTWGNPWEAEWMPLVRTAAAKFAHLIGAPPESVGTTASVSAALATVLSALDFRERRKVVVSTLEFPSVLDILVALRDAGRIELDVLEPVAGDLPLSLVDRAIDEQTALVCVSSVSYRSGSQLPVREIADLAHERGALCLVDAYQSLGALKLDVADVRADVVVSGTLKYLLGTPGVALLYARPELAAALEPTATGWRAQSDPFSVRLDRLDYADGGARFEAGTPSIIACYAADAALELLLTIGSTAIEGRILRLARAFVEGLQARGVVPLGPTGPGQLGPMVAVPVRGDPYEWQYRLAREERVITSARGKALRFAFHCYSTPDDVEACLDILDRTQCAIRA